MYDQIIKKLYQHHNLEQAASMTAYMKNQFRFLGLPSPVRKDLEKEFIKVVKKEKQLDWDFIVRCWDLPEREFQYLAMDILGALHKKLEKKDVEHIENLIVQKSWWDTVDFLAGTLIGELCKRHPELIQSHVMAWSQGDNLWLRRSAILFQLKYKNQTDSELLAKIIEFNNNSKQFFINKAIGWALREYSKVNPEWVKSFIENTQLHSLSIREGSKYI